MVAVCQNIYKSLELDTTQSEEQPNQLVTHTQSVVTQPHVTQSIKVVEPSNVPGLDVDDINTPTRLVYLHIIYSQ